MSDPFSRSIVFISCLRLLPLCRLFLLRCGAIRLFQEFSLSDGPGNYPPLRENSNRHQSRERSHFLPGPRVQPIDHDWIAVLKCRRDHADKQRQPRCRPE